MRMPSEASMAIRLRRVLDSATPMQLQDGHAWYQQAYDTCAGLAVEHGLKHVDAAGIVAALSPRLHWSRNVAAARELMATGQVHGVLGESRRKAERILSGEAPATVLSGLKVVSFWHALCGDLDQVVVDVWAARGAGWPERIRFDGVPVRYGRIASAYRSVAGDYSMKPCVTQATVWCAMRGRSS